MEAPRQIREHCTGERTFDCAFRSITAENRSDEGMTVRGVAAVFDSDSEPIFGCFIERIDRGAFTKVLRGNPDVRFLINHDGLPLARTENGTLRLTETPRGLEFEADIADTQLGRDLCALVQRGDIDQMSFAFTVTADEWRYHDGKDMDLRVIREIGSLPEISAVTFPAYRATELETVSQSADPDQEQREQADASEQFAPADGVQAQQAANDQARAIGVWLDLHHNLRRG